MGQRTGKEQYFTFNLIDLTNSLAAEVKLSMGADEIDASTINAGGFKSFLQGMYEGNITVSGVWDDGTATTGLHKTMLTNVKGGGTKLWEFAPAGSAANRPLLKGNGFLTAFEVGGAQDGLVGFSATIKNAGTIIDTVVS